MAKQKCQYEGCNGTLVFAGITTREGMNRARCTGCGRLQWRPSVSDIGESGWRLTLPASRVHDAARVTAMLPEADGRWIKQVFDLFANLPKPRKYRRGQQGMGYGAALAIERNMVLLANAGVGIGKTYAYLIPILLRMKRSPSTTAVISTGTILLQHQLMGDLEEAQKIVGGNIPIRVIKGQNQYLCMRKLQGLDLASITLPDSLSGLRADWAKKHEALVRERIQQLKKITRTVHGRGGYFGHDREERVYSDRGAEDEAQRAVSGPEFGEDVIS